MSLRQPVEVFSSQAMSSLAEREGSFTTDSFQYL
jgi:hypothetical protein